MEIQERIIKATQNLVFFQLLAELREDSRTLKSLLNELVKYDDDLKKIVNSHIYHDSDKRFTVTIDERPWRTEAYIDFYGTDLPAVNGYGVSEYLKIRFTDKFKSLLSSPTQESPIPKFFKNIADTCNLAAEHSEADIHVGLFCNGQKLRITVYKDYSHEMQLSADFIF